MCNHSFLTCYKQHTSGQVVRARDCWFVVSNIDGSSQTPGAKLSAYGLNTDSLQLIRSYLSNRQQRVKINSSFSDWKEIKNWSTPRVSPRAFTVNVFINDIFWFANRTKICNYADDATIFACHPDLGTIIKQ